MPYKIVKRGNEHCVTKTTGETVHCHPTHAKAVAHMRALYANVPDARPSAATWQKAMSHLLASFEQDHPFGWATVTLSPSGVRYIAALAETEEQHGRGMIGRSFDQFGAMLFAYDDTVLHAFHMRGVTEQLYIAWFADDGELVDRIGMFTSDPWEYRPAVGYRWALELPAATGDRSGTTVPGGAGAMASSTWAWLDGQTISVEPFEPQPVPERLAGKGVSIGRDANGKFFVYTHRARTPGYSTIDEIPDTDIAKVEQAE